MARWKHNIWGVKNFESGFDLTPIRVGDTVVITKPKNEREMTNEGKKATVIKVWNRTKELTIEFADGEELDVSRNIVKRV